MPLAWLTARLARAAGGVRSTAVGGRCWRGRSAGSLRYRPQPVSSGTWPTVTRPTVGSTLRGRPMLPLRRPPRRPGRRHQARPLPDPPASPRPLSHRRPRSHPRPRARPHLSQRLRVRQRAHLPSRFQPCLRFRPHLLSPANKGAEPSLLPRRDAAGSCSGWTSCSPPSFTATAGRCGEPQVVCQAAVMSQPADHRSGPFWEFLDGRRPAPPAAVTLGWTLSWVAPERGEIEVFFNARDGFANPMGQVQGGFLAAMLDDTLGPALVATRSCPRFGRSLRSQ